MSHFLNEKKICQLIDKIDKSLFVNGGILPCTFEDHDDIVAIREALMTLQTFADYGIIEFNDDEDGCVFNNNINLEKYVDDKGFVKLPKVPEVEE